MNIGRGAPRMHPNFIIGRSGKYVNDASGDPRIRGIVERIRPRMRICALADGRDGLVNISRTWCHLQYTTHKALASPSSPPSPPLKTLPQIPAKKEYSRPPSPPPPPDLHYEAFIWDNLLTRTHSSLTHHITSHCIINRHRRRFRNA